MDVRPMSDYTVGMNVGRVVGLDRAAEIVRQERKNADLPTRDVLDRILMALEMNGVRR